MQIGDNVNLFDWTYVSNVVKAHLLAADKFLDSPLAIDSVTALNLETISLTTGKYTIPSGDSRLGSALEFDPLSAENIELEPSYPLPITSAWAGFLHHEQRTYVFLGFCTGGMMRHQCSSWTINIQWVWTQFSAKCSA